MSRFGALFSSIRCNVLCLLALSIIFSSFSAAAVLRPASLSQRQAVDDGSGPGVLIGDLRTQITSDVGRDIANILTGNADAQSSVINSGPTGTCKVPKKGSAKQKSDDPCCLWYQISQDLTNRFRGPSGRCNDMARAAIRLGFHDAGTWSQSLANSGSDFGGADGSFILFNELSRSENRGLEGIDAFARKLLNKYPVGAADLIQYMSIHATVTCPLGPRIKVFVGRQDASQSSPTGLLPPVTGSADQLISLFADKTVRPHDIAALLGAHSTSKQFFVDPSKSGKPQDSTPGVWDVRFFNETLQNAPVKGTFRFLSDQVLSSDSRLRNEWVSFVGDQIHWNLDYAAAYTRISLLGVNNINDLTECTATLPAARPIFGGSSDGGNIDQ